jgi:hypothetical protein
MARNVDRPQACNCRLRCFRGEAASSPRHSAAKTLLSRRPDRRRRVFMLFLCGAGPIGSVITWEALMGVLMLTCPETGREFSTGIYIEEADFQRLPDTVTKAACPSCRQQHSWWTRQARLSDEVEASQWATFRQAS